MLTDQAPSDVLIEWASDSKVVHYAKDRPWFHEEPPIFAPATYKPNCRCHTPVDMTRYPCEDGAGYVYIGQCSYCQTIIWSYLETVEK